MYQEFDFFDRHQVPQIWLCNPDQSKIGNLRMAYNINPTLRFNSMSEISLTFPAYIKGDNGEDIKLETYDLIESKRLIFVEELGYFMINGVTEVDDGIQAVKDITAYSLESELSFKKINLISGTYQFWNPINPSTSLLGKVFESIPSWSMGYVDVELWDLWRTFDVADSTVYQFLMETIEKSYECVFTFDTFNRTVSAYSLENATSKTDIYMSFDNLLNNINIEELSDEIVTALKVYGDAELDISGVNPLGTPTIYNFDYYKNSEWMSEGLIDAINNWEQKIADSTESYKQSLLDIKNANTRLYVKGGTSTNDEYTATIGNGSTTSFTITHNLGTTCPSVLVRDIGTSGLIDVSDYYVTYSTTTPNSFVIRFYTAPQINAVQITARNTGYYVIQAETQTEYDELMQVKAARIDGNMDFTDINQQLDIANSQLSVINTAIKSQDNVISSRGLILSQINERLQMYNSFTQEQLVELDPFIIENTYQNSAFIQTDTMTLVEIQDMQEQLMAQGESILQRVSIPRYTFAVDSANFMFLKAYTEFTHQLQLGSIMNIRVNESLVATPILLELQFSYDDPDNFSMIFGNRYRLDDSAYIFSDLFNDSLNASVSSNFNQELWQKFVNSGADVALNDLLTEAWDAAKNEIVNSANQQIVIDGAGLRGRSQNNDGSYDDKQVWLTGKSLAFTRDGWDTVSLALGEITLGGVKYYGLAAEAVVGQLIAGSNLQIANTNNSFVVDGDGVKITSGNFQLTSSDGKSRMIFNPTDGFKIQGRTTSNGTWGDKLSVDGNGNLTMSGTVYANAGSFTGTVTANAGKIGDWNIKNGNLSNAGNDVYLSPTAMTDSTGSPGAYMKVKNFYVGDKGIWFGNPALDGSKWRIIAQGNSNSPSLEIFSAGDGIRMGAGGDTLTFNGKPVMTGAYADINNFFEAASGIAQIPSAPTNITNQTFVIPFNTVFSSIPVFSGTLYYRTNANPRGGAATMKVREVTTSYAVVTIGLGDGGDSWSEIYNSYDRIGWVAMGYIRKG